MKVKKEPQRYHISSLRRSSLTIGKETCKHVLLNNSYYIIKWDLNCYSFIYKWIRRIGYKVTVFGSGGVGKTSLLIRYINNRNPHLLIGIFNK
jgi:DNA replication protein DnaC